MLVAVFVKLATHNSLNLSVRAQSKLQQKFKFECVGMKSEVEMSVRRAKRKHTKSHANQLLVSRERL